MGDPMNTKTMNVLATVALIVATGVSTVEMTRSASANPMLVSGARGAYATARVDAVFAVTAAMPAERFTHAVAQKGDKLPVGCAGPLEPAVAAECLDTAYEIDSEPSLVVETRVGSTSILTRMDGFTVAAEY